MRWGTVTMPAGANSSLTVSWANDGGPAFANTAYSVTATLENILANDGCAGDKFAQYRNKATDSVVLVQQGASCSNNAYGFPISWMAIGVPALSS